MGHRHYRRMDEVGPIATNSISEGVMQDRAPGKGISERAEASVSLIEINKGAVEVKRGPWLLGRGEKRKPGNKGRRQRAQLTTRGQGTHLETDLRVLR